MGLIEGYIKYVIGILLSFTGIASMYVFGGSIITLINTLPLLFSGNFIETYIYYLITKALPPSSINQIIIQPIIGACTAGMLWFIAMAKRGIPL